MEHPMPLRLVAFALFLAATSARADMIAFTGTPAAPPEHFEFARTGRGGPGKWAIIDDTTAEGGRAVEQTSNEKTDYRFPLAIYQPLSAKDVDVSLRFKPMAGKVERAGRSRVRLREAENTY